MRNLSEGLVRVIILLAYMKLCTCVSDVKRLFSYHGAEHKTIFCYEHGKGAYGRECPRGVTLPSPLRDELSACRGRGQHPCQPVVRLDNSFARMGCHLLLLPIVVGISYEINRWCGLHDNWLSAALSAPGKWLQHLTNERA